MCSPNYFADFDKTFTEFLWRSGRFFNFEQEAELFGVILLFKRLRDIHIFPSDFRRSAKRNVGRWIRNGA